MVIDLTRFDGVLYGAVGWGTEIVLGFNRSNKTHKTAMNCF